MRRALHLFVAFAFVPCAAWPQGNPLGPEFRINTFTTGAQRVPSIAADSSGNFVVVWEGDGQDGSARGVLGQRYASSGMPLGPEFRVNSYTTDIQRYPSVAAGASGNFVVIWQSRAQDGSGYGVFGQRYAGSGAPLGPEFRVNTYTTGYQYRPVVASDASGNFVVVWTDDPQDGSGRDIFGQRYASSGVPLGLEFRVNTYITGSQLLPSIASDSSGNFIVVWESYPHPQDSEGVFGQRYASSGMPLGPEFRVNTSTTGFQAYPSVAADSSGNFVVAWLSNDGSSYGVFGQRYASSGAPLGPEFRVNTYTTGFQTYPSVAADTTGNFVVAWMSADGSPRGVIGQRYASSGTPQGPQFRVNTYTTSYQDVPSVAADSSGNFVVVWHSDTQDGSGYGVFGQRYAQIVPVELMHFQVE